MGSPLPESEDFWTKISFYLAYGLGVGAGVASKLAVMARTKQINVKDIVINTTIAFGASFSAYFLMKNKGIDQNIMLFVSVFLGRFADDIYRIVWASIKDWAKVLLKKIN